MLDDNAKMHAMKAIMDYADGAEGDQMKASSMSVTPRRVQTGGLSDPNFMKDSGKTGGAGEPKAGESAADASNGEDDDEDDSNPLKKLMGMFGSK